MRKRDERSVRETKKDSEKVTRERKREKKSARTLTPRAKSKHTGLQLSSCHRRYSDKNVYWMRHAIDHRIVFFIIFTVSVSRHAIQGPTIQAKTFKMYGV